MEEAAARRRYDEQHEAKPFHDGKFASWTEKPDAAHPYHYMDGVTVLVAETDLYPEDKFLRPREGFSDSPI